MVVKEDVGAAGPTILLRARDVTEQNFGAIADFAKQLGAQSGTAPSKRDRQRQSQVPVPTTVAQFPVGGVPPTSVVSTATAPRVATEETHSGALVTQDQFLRELRREKRKRERHGAEKGDTTRSQSERDEKRGSSTSRVVKAKPSGRCELMTRLIRGGVLRYANADPVEEIGRASCRERV